MYYERPGHAQISKLLRVEGMTMDIVVRHYTFVSEYLWTRLDPRVEGKLISVWDIEGIGE